MLFNLWTYNTVITGVSGCKVELQQKYKVTYPNDGNTWYC